MFLGYQNGKIKFYTEKRLDDVVYNIDESVETDKEYVYDVELEEYVLKGSEWAQAQAVKREKDFKEQFFEIEDYGWFRKAPKGYSSAVEAMSAAFNMVSIVGYLPANTLTFYVEPNFTDETQCTEEWLVTNSYKNEELSTTAFGRLYAKFLEGWNKLEHI